eukprot:g679.t1
MRQPTRAVGVGVPKPLQPWKGELTPLQASLEVEGSKHAYLNWRNDLVYVQGDNDGVDPYATDSIPPDYMDLEGMDLEALERWADEQLFSSQSDPDFQGKGSARRGRLRASRSELEKQRSIQKHLDRLHPTNVAPFQQNVGRFYKYPYCKMLVRTVEEEKKRTTSGKFTDAELQRPFRSPLQGVWRRANEDNGARGKKLARIYRGGNSGSAAGATGGADGDWRAEFAKFGQSSRYTKAKQQLQHNEAKRVEEKKDQEAELAYERWRIDEEAIQWREEEIRRWERDEREEKAQKQAALAEPGAERARRSGILAEETDASQGGHQSQELAGSATEQEKKTAISMSSSVQVLHKGSIR